MVALAGLGVVAGAAAVGSQLALAVGLTLVSTAIAERKAKSAVSGSFGTELFLSGDPTDVRTIPYGRFWTAGTLRYRNSAGDSNRDLYLVVVLAGTACDAVEAVQADRETLTLDGSGNVTSPSKWVGRMNVRFLLGSDTQTADSTLDSTFSNWTSDHRLRGCTLAIVKLTFDETNLNTLPAFRFLLRGRKVYDPRLDSTNGGSGSHRLNDPTTWAWSQNAVLCHNDYWRGVFINGIRIAGPGVSSGRFHWPNVIAEANVCDENVALAAGGNQKRYTANGLIDPRQPHGQVLEMFEQALAGDIPFCDRRWRYFCGAYRAPTLTLTSDHFVAPVRLVAHKSESSRRDTAHGRYSALAEQGTPVTYSPVSLASAVVGSERVVGIDMQIVNDETNTVGVYDGGARAQRIAKLLLERDAAGKHFTATTNLYGARAVPGESINVTHGTFGMSSQVMRVFDIAPKFVVKENGRIGAVVDVTLGAGPSSLYSWSAEETAIGASPTLPQLVIPPFVHVGWTPILTNVSRLGSTYTKTGGTNGAWDASFYSQQGFEACAVSFRFSQTNKGAAVGLDGAPAASSDFDSINYKFYGNSSGNAFIFAGATQIAALGSYTTSDHFRISYDGLRLRFYKNSTLVFQVAEIGSTYFLDASLLDTGAAVDSVSFTQLTHVPPLATGWAADSQGKPAGVRQGYSSAGTPDRATLSLVNGSLRIAATPTTGNEFCLPAIPIDPAKTYQFTISRYGTVASADGLYLRFEEYSGSSLPAGKTHIGDAAGSYENVFVSATSAKTPVGDGAITTTPTTDTFTYTPTAGTKFASLGLWNYQPNTTTELIIEWAALCELGTNVDLLPGVLPPLNTFDLNQEAATEVAAVADASDSVFEASVGFFTINHTIISASIDVEAGDVVEVTAFFKSVGFTKTGTSQIDIEHFVFLDTDISQGGYLLSATAASGVRDGGVLVGTFTGVSGTVSAGLYATLTWQSGSSNVSGLWNNIELRVTKVKR